MEAFLAVTTYKYDILAIDSAKRIWRIYFDGRQPLMQELFGDELEYHTAIRLLRAQRDLYS